MRAIVLSFVILLVSSCAGFPVTGMFATAARPKLLVPSLTGWACTRGRDFANLVNVSRTSVLNITLIHADGESLRSVFSRTLLDLWEDVGQVGPIAEDGRRVISASLSGTGAAQAWKGVLGVAALTGNPGYFIVFNGYWPVEQHSVVVEQVRLLVLLTRAE